jgi:hypothetical protein
MSNASLNYVKYDPSHGGLQKSAVAFAAKAKSSAKFVTYVAAEGNAGEAVTVVLGGTGVEEAEKVTIAHKTTGAALLASGPKQGVSGVKSRGVTISSFGSDASAKPYALAFVVSYAPENGPALRKVGQAISAHNSAFRYHVVRRDGVAGHAVVVVPVDALDALDKPVSAQGIAAELKGLVNSVGVVKLKRVAALSS